jgi:hypothetical protein
VAENSPISNTLIGRIVKKGRGESFAMGLPGKQTVRGLESSEEIDRAQPPARTPTLASGLSRPRPTGQMNSGRRAVPETWFGVAIAIIGSGTAESSRVPLHQAFG